MLKEDPGVSHRTTIQQLSQRRQIVLWGTFMAFERQCTQCSELLHDF
jgi:hypothetical protein